MVPCPASVGMNMTKCRLSGFPSLKKTVIFTENTVLDGCSTVGWDGCSMNMLTSGGKHLHESPTQPGTEHGSDSFVESLLPRSL